MTLKLELVTRDLTQYDAQLEQYRQAYATQNEVLHGGFDLDQANITIESWRERVDTYRFRATVPANLVPAETYLVIRQADQRLVGLLNLRLALNDYLRQYGGHIGYSIALGEWGKGYGTEMLRLALVQAKAHGMPKVLVTCATTNHRSARVIEKNGGSLENTIEDPHDGQQTNRYWIPLT